jgi:uncharacterized protein YoxC
MEDQNTKRNKAQYRNYQDLPVRITDAVGSGTSIVLHTIFFVGIFLLRLFGVSTDRIMLILTTAVSLEAIYLSLFIQMSVNRNTQSLEEVEEDVAEIQEDVEGIEKDIDEIQEDVDEMQEDVEGMEKDIDEIQGDIDKLEEDDAEDDMHTVATIKTLSQVQADLEKLMKDIEQLKTQKK